MSTSEGPKYVAVNGTSYHAQTSREVIDVLERARQSGQRIRVHYGDTETGRDYGDIYDVTGVVGRSTGPRKVPLMIANVRSMGGGAMLDHCIVRIRHANRRDGGDLYRHPSYSPPPRDDLSDRLWERHFGESR